MNLKLAESIGTAAREARTQVALTQADVAERLGIATEVYGRMERGLMLPSVETFRKLCVTLGMSSSTALNLGTVDASESPPRYPGVGESPEVRRLFRWVERLGRRRIRLLIQVAAELVRGSAP